MYKNFNLTPRLIVVSESDINHNGNIDKFYDELIKNDISVNPYRENDSLSFLEIKVKSISAFEDSEKRLNCILGKYVSSITKIKF
jgi:hypothetical protein